MSKESNLLIIFTKNPTLGKVKTRLAKTIGKTKALSVFQNLLAQATKVAKAWDGEVWVFYSDFIPKQDIWTDVATKTYLQKGDDLGTRMAQAFQQGLSLAGKVVLMGTDIPKLSVPVIDEAFEELDKTDFVVGPTFDGGYYLIGMNQPNLFVFADMEWSTPEVFARTIMKIKTRDYTYSTTPRLVDVDYEEDLVEFEWLLQ